MGKSARVQRRLGRGEASSSEDGEENGEHTEAATPETARRWGGVEGRNGIKNGAQVRAIVFAQENGAQLHLKVFFPCFLLYLKNTAYL